LRLLNLGSFKSEKQIRFRFSSMTSNVFQNAQDKFKFTDEEIKNVAVGFKAKFKFNV